MRVLLQQSFSSDPFFHRMVFLSVSKFLSACAYSAVFPRLVWPNSTSSEEPSRWYQYEISRISSVPRNVLATLLSLVYVLPSCLPGRELSVPVTVKIRAQEKESDTLDLARRLEGAGAQLLTGAWWW